jgi:hypothetical protein
MWLYFPKLLVLNGIKQENGTGRLLNGLYYYMYIFIYQNLIKMQ